MTKKIAKIGLTILMIPVLFVGQVAASTETNLQQIDNSTEYYDGSQCDDNTVSTSNTAAVNLPVSAPIEQQIAQTFIVGIDVSNTPLSVVQDIVSKFKIGGIVFTDTTNATAAGYNSSFFSELNNSDDTPLLIASDEEGGQVSRFTYPDIAGGFPSAQQMGAMSTSVVQQLGQEVGKDLKKYGLTTDLAPVLDLNDGTNIISQQDRSFGSTPKIVSQQAGAFAQGLESSSITPTFKHFPGFGGAGPGDTDTTPVTVPSSYSLATNVEPYKTLLASDTNANVMLSNLYIPDSDYGSSSANTSTVLPTSINPVAINYLRQTLNFTGLITTDDLGALSSAGYVSAGKSISLPAAIGDALSAGADMPLFGLDDGYTGTMTDALAEAQLQDDINAVKSSVPTGDITSALKVIMAAKTVSNSSSTSNNTASCCSTTSVTLTGNTVEEQVLNYYLSQGLSAAQAAGIAGNMEEQSSFVPTINQSDPHGPVPAAQMVSNPEYNNDEDGWGLVQWTPPSKMIGPLLAKGIDPDTVADQLTFLWQQMTSQGYDLVNSGTTVLSQLKMATDPSSAALSFFLNYEDNDPSDTAAIAETEAAAVTIFATMTNSPNATNPPPNSQPPTTTTTSDSSSCQGSSVSSSSAYQNPLRGLQNLEPMRIDQGVDYGGTGPIYAIGDGTIESVSAAAGWPGANDGPGTFISYKLSNGPAAGDWVYIAENCPNIQVTPQESVTSSTVLCDEQDADPYIETGWAVPALGDLQAAAHNFYDTAEYPDGTATVYGRNFSALLQSLGAQPGDLYGSYDHGNISSGTLPPGWPTW